MLTIELRFPTGKWHATPWGRQVNEGAVEWPPAPWRLLRALLAVWHHKGHDIPETEIRELIDVLTSTQPVFRLPTETSEGHTRHYMPAPEKKTKIFDTFLVVNPDDPLVIIWNHVVLSEPQRALLDRLLKSMSYFGRAESWVCARLGNSTDIEPNTVPLNGQGVGRQEELVRLLVPSDAESFLTWRGKMIVERKERKLTEKRDKAIEKDKDPKMVKLTPKDQQIIEGSLPATMFDALHAETDALRKAGWNRPPGSEWIDYVRPKSIPVSAIPRNRSTGRALSTVARFAVAGAVRPRLTEALWIGERVRQFVMGCSKKQNDGQCSSVFSGKSPEGQPRKSDQKAHQHAHYLCESVGRHNKGRITHVAIYAPEGFTAQDERALARFRHTWGHGGHDLQFVLLGIGQPEDFGGTDEKKGESPILATSNVWVSRTPFVTTDHVHIRSKEKSDPQTHLTALHRELTEIVRRELRRRDWLSLSADSVDVRMIESTLLGGTNTTWLEFRRTRQRGGGQQSSTLGYGFKLTFPETVTGPVTLGYGAHFGLGQFVPG